MKVIFNYKKDYRTKEPSAIALGTFDGIHLGHRRLIKELMEKGRIWLSNHSVHLY